jgi:hypothetical protein
VDLPGSVYFHRESPTSEIILQVPNNDRTDSETYILDPEGDADHRLWMERLPESKRLTDLLTWAQHVAYDTMTGHAAEMTDLDATPRGQRLMAEAHADKGGRFTFARRQTMPLGEPHLRQSLANTGRPGWGKTR